MDASKARVLTNGIRAVLVNPPVGRKLLTRGSIEAIERADRRFDLDALKGARCRIAQYNVVPTQAKWSLDGNFPAGNLHPVRLSVGDKVIDRLRSSNAVRRYLCFAGRVLYSSRRVVARGSRCPIT